MKRLIPCFLAIPNIAFSEVMDKEASLQFVWLMALISSTLGFLAGRYFPMLLVLVLPVPLMFFFAHLSEVADPFVGPAMLEEAGLFYVVSSWFGPVLFILSTVCGLRLRYVHRRGT